jgi:hypothetical protein
LAPLLHTIKHRLISVLSSDYKVYM